MAFPLLLTLHTLDEESPDTERSHQGNRVPWMRSFVWAKMGNWQSKPTEYPGVPHTQHPYTSISDGDQTGPRSAHAQLVDAVSAPAAL